MYAVENAKDTLPILNLTTVSLYVKEKKENAVLLLTVPIFVKLNKAKSLIKQSYLGCLLLKAL